MSEQNVDLVRSIYEAFSTGDIAGVLGPMAPAIEWLEAENFPYADGNPYIGPQSILNGVFIRLAADWEKFKVIPEHFHDAGNTVVVCGRYRAKNNQTGTAIDAQMAHVWTIVDGQIAKFHEYTDTLQFARAIKPV